MRYNSDKTNQFELIVKDEDQCNVYIRDFGTDLSKALEKAEEFEKAHPTWRVEIWQSRITYQEGRPS